MPVTEIPANEGGRHQVTTNPSTLEFVHNQYRLNHYLLLFIMFCVFNVLCLNIYRVLTFTALRFGGASYDWSGAAGTVRDTNPLLDPFLWVFSVAAIPFLAKMATVLRSHDHAYMMRNPRDPTFAKLARGIPDVTLVPQLPSPA